MKPPNKCFILVEVFVGSSMNIYNKIHLYDKFTGKLTKEFVVKIAERRCDYSGVPIGDDPDEFPKDDGVAELCNVYKLDYENTDPCFGSPNDEYDFGRKYKIVMQEFLGADSYIFSLDADYSPWAETSMIKEVYESNEFSGFNDLFRSARIKTAIKLIEEGKVKPENLLGYYRKGQE